MYRNDALGLCALFHDPIFENAPYQIFVIPYQRCVRVAADGYM